MKNLIEVFGWIPVGLLTWYGTGSVSLGFAAAILSFQVARTESMLAYCTSVILEQIKKN
jgi:hypothetical protein